MNNKITPFQLVNRIKDFGGSNAKFYEALAPSDKLGFKEFKKKNLHVIDDCVREEAMFNMLIDKMSTTPAGFSIIIGHKEKALLQVSFDKFRNHMLTKSDCDVAVYDNAYQQLLMIISE